jgi:flagellar hook-associated protein 2
MNAINNSKELGIKVSYQSNTDKFVVQSTEQGAGGQIELKGNLASVLFGAENTNYTVEQGQDAVILVQYAGSNTTSEITRGSNTISMDGLNVTLKGTFGYKDGKYVEGTSAVTFNASVDTDNTTSIVKEMIDAYNEALDLINSEVNQKPDRDYTPLTDEQKEEMSDSQIEKWETEAKKGLLFNDTDLRGLADSLRFIIPSGFRADLEKMGITVSTSYKDNGKLVFNETEFKAALGTDPDAVMQAFTATVSKNEDGTTNAGGLMTSMKTIMDRYASMTGATKGILVERAGSVYAPTSVLKNGMQTQIDSIKDYITQLNKKLATEQDRYVSQFTALETLISQMNSQSGYLSSMFSS